MKSAWDEVSAPVVPSTQWDRISTPVETPDQSDAETARLQRQNQQAAPKSGLSPTAQAYRIGNPESAPGYFEQWVGGGKRAWDKAALGLKGVFTDLTEDDKRLLERGKSFVKETGPASTIGELATDVGMSMAPVARGAQVLTKALGFAPRVAPLVADVASNAGYAALTNPENRTEAALYGGGGALVGRGANRVASGLVKPTEAAQAMMDDGVRLTPGQAGGGKGWGAVANFGENAVEAVPVIGSPIRNAREQAVKDWSESMVRGTQPRVSGEVSTIKGAQENLSKQYEHLLPKGEKLTLPSDVLEDLRFIKRGLAEEVPTSQLGRFNELTDLVTSRLEKGVKADLLQEEVFGDLHSAIKAAQRDGQSSLARALSKYSQTLNNKLEVGEQLSALNDSYRQLKVLQRTGNRMSVLKRKQPGEEVFFYPSEVIGEASKNKTGSKAVLSKALAAQELLGSPPTEMGRIGNLAKAVSLGAGGYVAPMVSAPPAVIALLGSSELGRKVLLGQIPWQELARRNPMLAETVGRAMALSGEN